MPRVKGKGTLFQLKGQEIITASCMEKKEDKVEVEVEVEVELIL